MQPVQTQDVAGQQVATTEPFKIRGRSFTALALRPSGQPDQAFYDLLDEKLAANSAFFDNAPVVVDLEAVSDEMNAADLRSMLEQLKQRRMSLIGLQNGNRAQIAVAAAAGLLAMPAGRDAKVSAAKAAQKQEPKPEPKPDPNPALQAQRPPAMIVTEPVRSGQKLYAEHGDLVVVASVSPGAELVARGNIHVYGKLRGRALAGVAGDTSARIFCNSMQAELLAVAGIYQTSEDFDAAISRQPVQAFLQDDSLHICPIT